MTRQYRETETTLQAILDSSAVAVGWANQRGEIEYVNPEFISMFGYTTRDIPSLTQWHTRAYPDNDYRNRIVAEWEAEVEQSRASGSHMPPFESLITCKNNTTKQVQLLSSWAGSKLLLNFTDITELKRAQELSAHMAQHDHLTGLPNRMLFADRIEQAISLAKRDQHHLAVLFVDLDKFKSVNDQLGHEVGDLLLQEVAKRMQDCIRESDTVARIGGDEFLVLLPVINQTNDAVLTAEKIRFVLNSPFIITGHSIENSSSIGLTFYPDHGKNQSSLIRNADIAMYTAKQNGGNSVVTFNSKMINKHESMD
ncbi:sensor domain-containing diguanylate cyclase [Amphritea pacifica]|uniref:GGDEF domain-containing protein n=1 Tax=Amphritea pacifica TaxID=2811233 RepID=A0ABS2WDJ3_9GAMM|nr:sensor domain-containing diguanylate cyclase [Amphritea pacifica]MBN0989776.1 GGDEF domain-containing protein [Amphritea pacifica]MBN1007647.1 GGDEF domain-containing protein [Amphritea pacifica]